MLYFADLVFKTHTSHVTKLEMPSIKSSDQYLFAILVLSPTLTHFIRYDLIWNFGPNFDKF